jgi:hypothetical protein
VFAAQGKCLTDPHNLIMPFAIEDYDNYQNNTTTRYYLAPFIDRIVSAVLDDMPKQSNKYYCSSYYNYTSMIKLLSIVNGQHVRDLLHSHLYPPTQLQTCQCSFNPANLEIPECEYHKELFSKMALLYSTLYEDNPRACRGLPNVYPDPTLSTNETMKQIAKLWYPFLLDQFEKKMYQVKIEELLRLLILYIPEFIFTNKEILDKTVSLLQEWFSYSGNPRIILGSEKIQEKCLHLMQSLINKYHEYKGSKIDMSKYVPNLARWKYELSLKYIMSKQDLLHDVHEHMEENNTLIDIYSLLKVIDTEDIRPLRDDLLMYFTKENEGYNAENIAALAPHYNAEEIMQ